MLKDSGKKTNMGIIRERIKFIMKIPKNAKSRMIVVIIFIFMIIAMFTALQSCENEIEPDPVIIEILDERGEVIGTREALPFELESFDMPELTDKFIVYMNFRTEYFLIPAINIFKAKYPGVEIEIVNFDEAEEEFRTILTTELAAGRGPDLVLAQSRDFPDIYKTMATGIFTDLNHFIESDNEFNMSEYNQAVLEAGVLRGRRYLIPIQYNVPILMTTQEILDAEGINSADLSTFDNFIRTAEKFNEKYKDNPNKSVFPNWHTNSRNVRNFFPHIGINLIDYQTNTVAIDKTKFKNIMDIMKKTYIRDEGIAVRSNMIEYEGLKDKNLLFSIESTIGWIFYDTNDRLAENNLTPQIFPYPNINNGVTADVQYFAAIPKSSENQINAYNLLKIILSEDIQAETMYIFENPVLKSAVRKQADRLLNSRGTHRPRHTERMNEYINIMTNITSAKMMPYAPYHVYIIEEMIPYFNGARSFDDAYARLVNRLEIYASE